MANIPLKTLTFPGLDDTYTIPQVDNTLATAGDAADAKKTGDEISQIKADLGDSQKVVDGVLSLESMTEIPYSIAGSGYIASNGKIGTNADNSYTDYIPFGIFTHIVYKRGGVTGSSVQYTIVYNSDKTISRTLRWSSNQSQKGYVDSFGSITKNNDETYVRFTTFTDTDTYGEFAVYGDANPLKTKIEYLDNAVSGIQDDGNVLNGKKWVACGDSFTHGDFSNAPTADNTFADAPYNGENKVYPFYVGRRNQGMTVINEAINGSTMGAGENGINPFSGTRYTAIPEDADYITLMFGINDVGHGVPLGTIDDSDNTTFYGAWNVVLGYLVEHFPFAHIGIIVGPGMQTATGQQYANAEIAIAKKWGIPYLNIQFESGGERIPLMLRTSNPDVSASVKALRNSQQYVSDASGSANHHPNAKAHEFESAFIEAWLRSI